MDRNSSLRAKARRFQWTDLTTQQTTTESLYTLFAGLPNFGNISSILDTRLVYDAANGLYVLEGAIYYNNSNNIDLVIATSANPSAGWTVATLATGSTSTDMPGLAVDGANVYLSAQVSGGTTEFVVPFSTITNGASLSTSTPGITASTNSNNGNFYSVAGGGYNYMIAGWTNTTVTYLSFQTQSAANGATSATQFINLNLSNVGGGGNDFVASQMGSTYQIDAGSGKFMSLAYASVGGHNYVYGVSEVMPAAGAQPEFQWFQLDVTNAVDGVTPPVLVNGGDISATSLGFTSDVALFNSSIAVNAAGDVLINFTASGTSMDPSDYYIVAGPNQSFGAPVLYQASNAPFVAPDSFNTSSNPTLQRWGASFNGDNRSQQSQRVLDFQ